MSTEINMGEKPKRLHIGLTGSILIALGLGLLCGVIFHYLVPAGTVRDDVFVNGIFYIVGQGFIRLMQMLVVPLVFCSIVCGASSIGDTKTLGTIGLKTLVFYLCTTALAVTVALSIGNLINPGRGVDMSSMVASDTSTLSGSANTDVSFTDTPSRRWPRAICWPSSSSRCSWASSCPLWAARSKWCTASSNSSTTS